MPHLQTKWNSTSEKLGDKNNTHSCKLWLTIFLYSLKIFKLEKVVAGKEFGYFSLMSSEAGMNLERKVTTSSTPSASIQQGVICLNMSDL